MNYYDPFSDVLENAFNDALSRDSVTLTLFTTGAEIPAFLRTYSDNRSERNVETLYYSIDYDDYIKPGTVFSISGTYFIVINKEAVENPVYRKSTVIQSNGIVSTANRSVIGLPVYGEPVVNSNETKHDNFARYLDGDTDIMTECDNPLAQALDIGDVIYLYERYFKITNRFVIADVLHFIIEVTEEPADAVHTDVITGVMSGVDISVNKSTTGTDTVLLRMFNNGVEMRGNVIYYYSNDPTVATVNQTTGLITYIAEGTVTISAECQNISFSKTLSITVKNSTDSSIGYAIYFDPNTVIYPAMDNDIVVYAAHGGKIDSTVEISYRITTHNFDDDLLSQIVITPTTTGVTIYLDNRKLYGKTFTLEAYNTAHSVSKTQTFTIDNFI